MQRLASYQHNNFRDDTEHSRTRSASGFGSILMGDNPMAGAREQDETHRVSPTEAVKLDDAESNTYTETAVTLPASFDPTSEGLKPFPFFHYRDYSRVEDPDPCQHLTPPGRVPNFVCKMHAILSRSDLSEIISWLPHGRSWMILNPKKFEKEVLPVYFDHAKISSFIRQANGWGFRRLTAGRDRNSYYHPKFLRALPHLCKDMKRPGVSEKQPSDPDHEPELGLISQMFPVPEEPRDNSIFLQFILDEGPNARMPIFTGGESGSQFVSRKKKAQPTVSTGSADTSHSQQQQQASYAHSENQGQGAQKSHLQHQASSDVQVQGTNNHAQLSQALAGLPPIPPFIPSVNGGDSNLNNFDFSNFLPSDGQGGNSDTDPSSAAYHAGFMAAQAMFASQGDQIEQQLLSDPTIFSSFHPSDHSANE